MEAFEFTDPELVEALEKYSAECAARAARLANQVDESLLLGQLGRCTDLDEDCPEMTRDEVQACARLEPESGYCPFLD